MLIGICAHCGDPLYEGDDIFDLGLYLYHTECAEYCGIDETDETDDGEENE